MHGEPGVVCAMAVPAAPDAAVPRESALVHAVAEWDRSRPTSRHGCRLGAAPVATTTGMNPITLPSNASVRRFGAETTDRETSDQARRNYFPFQVIL